VNGLGAAFFLYVSFALASFHRRPLGSQFKGAAEVAVAEGKQLKDRVAHAELLLPPFQHLDRSTISDCRMQLGCPL